MNITSGIIQSPQKIVLYGPEGIGKSTFASKMPDPVFIDTEGSTKKLNVRRMDPPQSWSMLLSEAKYIAEHPAVCRSLIIDTMDWAEKLAVSHVLSVKKWSSIEDPGYGSGYRYVYEEMGKLLNQLTDVVNGGVNVLITAHAAMRKFEQPDEMGSYDRWELKLQNSGKCNVAAMVKEWADMVLFANYKTFVVTTQDKKNRAQGGSRVMYTTHHPCWDAKNRDGLPDELPFDFTQIAGIFGDPPQKKPPMDQILNKAKAAGVPVVETPPAAAEKKAEWLYEEPDQRVPQKLRELMIANAISEEDIEWAVSDKRGYFPKGMKIWEYPADFVDGVLVGAWQQVLDMILNEKYKGKREEF